MMAYKLHASVSVNSYAYAGGITVNLVLRSI